MEGAGWAAPSIIVLSIDKLDYFAYLTITLAPFDTRSTLFRATQDACGLVSNEVQVRT
jgi:hypothetical protein